MEKKKDASDADGGEWGEQPQQLRVIREGNNVLLFCCWAYPDAL